MTASARRPRFPLYAAAIALVVASAFADLGGSASWRAATLHALVASLLTAAVAVRVDRRSRPDAARRRTVLGLMVAMAVFALVVPLRPVTLDRLGAAQGQIVEKLMLPVALAWLALVARSLLALRRLPSRTEIALDAATLASWVVAAVLGGLDLVAHGGGATGPARTYHAAVGILAAVLGGRLFATATSLAPASPGATVATADDRRARAGTAIGLFVMAAATGWLAYGSSWGRVNLWIHALVGLAALAPVVRAAAARRATDEGAAATMLGVLVGAFVVGFIVHFPLRGVLDAHLSARAKEIEARLGPPILVLLLALLVPAVLRLRGLGGRWRILVDVAAIAACVAGGALGALDLPWAAGAEPGPARTYHAAIAILSAVLGVRLLAAGPAAQAPPPTPAAATGTRARNGVAIGFFAFAALTGWFTLAPASPLLRWNLWLHALVALVALVLMVRAVARQPSAGREAAGVMAMLTCLVAAFALFFIVQFPLRGVLDAHLSARAKDIEARLAPPVLVLLLALLVPAVLRLRRLGGRTGLLVDVTALAACLVGGALGALDLPWAAAAQPGPARAYHAAIAILGAVLGVRLLAAGRSAVAASASPPRSTAAVARARSGVAIGVLTVAAATGWFTLASTSWSPFFRWNLWIHPAIAVVALILVVRAVTSRPWAEPEGAGETAIFTALVTVFALFFIAQFPLREVLDEHLSARAKETETRLIPPLLILWVALLARTVRRVRRLTNRVGVLVDVTVISCWLVAGALGAYILVRRDGMADKAVFLLHTVLGTVAAALAAYLATAQATPGTRLRLLRNAVAVAGLALAVTAAAVNQLGAAGNGAASGPVDVEVSMNPESAASAAVPPVDASWLRISSSCGAADGCHGAMVHEAARSLHGSGSRAPHVRAQIAPDGGMPRASCAGCHEPAARFRDDAATSGRDAAGVTCVVCHSVSEVWIDQPVRARYTLRLDADLLAPFRAAEQRGGTLAEGDRRALRLAPRSHGRAFRPKLLDDDRFCGACHQIELRPPVVGAPCKHCHMQPAHEVGGSGGHANHLFPGSNVATPTALGDAALAELNAGFATQRFVSEVEHEEGPFGMRAPGRGVRAMGPPVEIFPIRSRLTLDPATASATLALHTHSQAITHAFPGFSPARTESWLEVHVTEAGGRILFTSGAPDADGRLPESAHRLGGPASDAAGAVGWHAARARGARLLLPGDETVDTFAFAVPPDVQGPLAVKAEWKYRKVAAGDWAAVHGPGPVPHAVVARHEAALPLEAPPRETR